MLIDPHELEICLKVLDQATRMVADDPQSNNDHTVNALLKAGKKLRKARAIATGEAARAQRRADDAAIIAATVTGDPDRIDDGAAELPQAIASSVGILHRSQSCYVCKKRYTQVDSFYHLLCPSCARTNHFHRHAGTNLHGRRALLTGGRAKIGMHIALKLLRDGANLTITTRFPRDAARRFSATSDSADWLDRLHIVGIDLRNPAHVAALADDIATEPLDIVINNAAQTIRHSPGAYSALVDAESTPLRGIERDVHMRILGDSSIPSAIEPATIGRELLANITVDAGGLLPERVSHNSWVAKVGEIDPIEVLEVNLCNVIAPFILINRLRPALEASPARRKYIVNVSAMEGIFHRDYKGPGHPHTNMAKAALNMLTRTSAEELFKDRILMTAVDTGWITDERPHVAKERFARKGFHTPLDLIDGAARVYHPIVDGENGIDLYGCFLKDYAPAAYW